MFNLDLNLLRLFDILIEVRSVSRAADRLGLTQSAVSHALGRLREQLDDPLFVRHRGGLRPTRRADEIASAVREGLRLLREAVSEPEFQPASSTRAFAISASSYFCATILPIVIRRARQEAPSVHLNIRPSGTEVMTEFEAGTLDLVLGAFGSHPAHLSKTPLFSDRLVWIGRVGSSRKNLDQRPRLAIARPFLPGSSDPSVKRDGDDDHITFVSIPGIWNQAGPVTTYDALTAGMLIAESDLVTLWPRQLTAMIAPNTRVEILGTANQPPFRISMLWPARLASDRAHSWLRGLLIDAASEIDGPV